MEVKQKIKELEIQLSSLEERTFKLIVITEFLKAKMDDEKDYELKSLIYAEWKASYISMLRTQAELHALKTMITYLQPKLIDSKSVTFATPIHTTIQQKYSRPLFYKTGNEGDSAGI